MWTLKICAFLCQQVSSYDCLFVSLPCWHGGWLSHTPIAWTDQLFVDSFGPASYVNRIHCDQVNHGMGKTEVEAHLIAISLSKTVTAWNCYLAHVIYFSRYQNAAAEIMASAECCYGTNHIHGPDSLHVCMWRQVSDHFCLEDITQWQECRRKVGLFPCFSGSCLMSVISGIWVVWSWQLVEFGTVIVAPPSIVLATVDVVPWLMQHCLSNHGWYSFL